MMQIQIEKFKKHQEELLSLHIKSAKNDMSNELKHALSKEKNIIMGLSIVGMKQVQLI